MLEAQTLWQGKHSSVDVFGNRCLEMGFPHLLFGFFGVLESFCMPHLATPPALHETP